MLIEISEYKTKDINIAMIDADTYCTIYHLKRIQVFVISISNI